MSVELSNGEFTHPAYVAETGRLCAAWAFLEIITDRIIWGYLGVNEYVGSFITAHRDIPNKWKMIVQEIEPHVSAAEFKTLKEINKAMQTISDDRNIIVHGQIVVRGNIYYATITRGSKANKLFPLSAQAVIAAMDNIRVVIEPALAIADRKKWLLEVKPDLEMVSAADWPKPISISP